MHLWGFSYLELNVLNALIYIAKFFFIWIFFLAQLEFKQTKFYFRFQNDRAKGRMGPSWAVMSFTEVMLRIFNR